MIGTQVVDTDGIIDAIANGRFDLSGYDAFIERQLGASRGGASDRFVRALPRGPAGTRRWRCYPSARCPPRVRSRQPFDNAAGDRGALRLIREAIADIRSRRRLVRYLVQADIRKRGADTLLGNIWWVLDPLLQMSVYVVFVTIVVAAADPRLPALHLRRDPALEVVHLDDRRRDRLDRRQGPADQADPVPEDRPADRGDGGRHRQLRVRAWSRSALLMLLLPAPDLALPAVHPGDRGRPVRVHAGVLVPRRGRQRLLPRPRQRRRPRPAPVVVPVARACTASPRSTT